MKTCDLFLRPTNSDGDSVSVRESLSLGVPVIASDAAPRPNGTILFRSRDHDDLTNKTIDVLNNLDDYKVRLMTLQVENNAEKMINEWRSTLKFSCDYKD